MRNDRLVPGTILVIIGALFLLDNFGYIDFGWDTFINLWPIILIIAGVNLVFAHNRTHWATAFKLAVLFIGMGILIWGGLGHNSRHHFNFSFNNHNNDKDDDDDDDSDSSDNNSANTNNYNVPLKGNVQTARLNISGGATAYTLTDSTSQLFAAQSKGHISSYTLKNTVDSGAQVIDFDMGNKKSHHFLWFGNHNSSNHVDVKLNIAPVWDINIESGASSCHFDLSKFKIKNIEFDGGAADCDIKMGQPLATTNVVIEAGASSVKIQVPQNAAVHITTDTGLSSNTFDGFDKKDDDTYQTPGFDQAANKMYIHIEGGMADFKVTRY